jgi:hypothetical protein
VARSEKAKDSGHGLLPDWGRAALPAPPAFTLPNVLRTIGPGVIGLGLAIGSGEWLLGPAVIVRYGPELLWVTTAAVLGQVFLNLEMARYTLYTGEPILVGFMRTAPGPAFWRTVYGALVFLQAGWPGFALATASALAALLLGRMPDAEDAPLVIRLGYLLFGACFLICLVGKKVERTLELAMWIMLGWVVGYLLLVDLTLVSAANWTRVARGFVSVGAMPEGADWLLLGAFAGFSGLGGVSNLFLTNWMRDKGYGMGATVGYIPAALGTPVVLSPQGNVFEVDKSSLQSWRGWWRFLNWDQWGILAVGSLVGMALTALLTLEYVEPGTNIGGWAVANFQAQGIARSYGSLFWYLTLVTGFWILFSTQLGQIDGLPRTVTDVIWVSRTRAEGGKGDVRKLYYAVLAGFALWGCLAMNLAQPLTLVAIGGNAASLTLTLAALHTLRLNRRFLPPELRPSPWREGAVLMCALFYGNFLLRAVWSKLQAPA